MARPTTMVCSALWILTVLAQAQQTPPSFAVATIKPNHSMSEAMGGGGFEKGTRMYLRNRNLLNLIELAYGVPSYRITGGPGWMTAVRYDIEAKPAAPVEPAQMLVMLQTLLAERFGLLVHHQTTRVQGYILSVEKGGSKLHRSEDPAGFRIMSQEEISGPGDMSMLARTLAVILGAPVEDASGLTGVYQVKLQWGLGEPPLSIFTAIKQQLGLGLKADKVAVDMIYVDHLERTPTEN